VIPSGTRIEPADRRTGVPNGATLSTLNTPYDFTRAAGRPLGDVSLDETYLDLHTGVLSDGPIAEVHDPAWNYGLRIISETHNITNLRVIAPADKPWVSIGPNTNLPDPFGHEWDHLDGTGMVILQPGDRMQWKVRVEIFSLAGSLGQGFGQ
jgi:hypothetical protein